MNPSGTYYRALVSRQARGLWPTLLRSGLWTASVPYGWATRLRNRLYEEGWKQSRQAAAPVVSIGNLTLGGTGKTPCVEYVAGFYRGQGLRTVILSRGYGSAHGPNDEALVLAVNLPDVPHLQGADRTSLAQRAVHEFGAQVLVLDDGFQHRRLARDLDVVLIDATQPWGHGYLFPRGGLREARGGVRRADLVMLTRCDQVNRVERGRIEEAVGRLAPNVPVVRTLHRPRELVNSRQERMAPERLARQPVAAVCGIGNPDAFRATLGSLGVRMIDFRTFPDHHAYSAADVNDLAAWARRLAKDCVVVTTQKDLVKLRRPDLGDRALWALRIGLHVEAGQEALDHLLRQAVGIAD